MATKVITQLVDDIDGSEAAETVSFGLDGQQFEIELSEANAATMRAALQGFVSAARRARAGSAAPQAPKGRATGTGPSQKSVREWAQGKGIEVSSRGRIPQTVLDQYAAAH